MPALVLGLLQIGLVGDRRDGLGLPDLARSPAYAVAAGLLRYALSPDRHLSLRGRFGEDAGSYLLKVGKWIKESF